MKEKAYMAVEYGNLIETTKFLIEIKDAFLIDSDETINVEVKKCLVCTNEKYKNSMKRGKIIKIKIPNEVRSAGTEAMEEYAESNIKKFEDVSQALLWWEMSD